ncbi:MAG: sterol desaturase family protein [Bacteroidetes bacterium]|nr:sterol desaturase family protein [Bacteroidota bacterium]
MHLSYSKKRFEKSVQPAVPAEQNRSLAFGSIMHVGPPILFIAILQITGIELLPAVIVFFSISVLNLYVVLTVEHKDPSVRMKKPSTKAILDGMILVFLKGIGIGSMVVAGLWFLLSKISIYNGLASSWPLIISAVFLTDLCYYSIHRWLNHGKGSGRIMKWYRKNHALHHAVPELDFMRGNVSTVFDTAVTGFQVPLAFISFLLGLDLASTLVAYGLVLMLQATHHVNYTFNIGVLRYVFMDNHAHKLHHCKKGGLVNHGALFSIWDRVFGTYYEDWSVSSNYMHFHGISLPIRKLGKR